MTEGDRTIHRVPEAPRIPEWITVEDPAAIMAENFRAVKPGGTIRIYVLEGEPILYNDVRVSTALQDAKEQGAKIRVNTASVVVVDDAGVNGLLQLHQGGVIDSVETHPARGSARPFHVVEARDRLLYYEEGPQNVFAGLQSRQRTIVNPELKDISAIARSASEDFDAYGKVFGKETHRQYPPLPLLASEATFRAIVGEARQAGFGFTYAEPTRLLTLPSGSDLRSYVPPQNGR